MKTKDELASITNRPPKLAEASRVKAWKVGWRAMASVLRASGRQRVALGFSVGTLSSKRRPISARVATPKRAGTISATCQSRCVAIRPPSSGLAKAMMPSPAHGARHDARTVERRIEVADDGAPARHRRGHREALQRPPADQRVDRGRERAEHAGERVQREAAEQHRPTAVTIRQGPADELTEAEADDQRGERLLRRAGGGAEVARDGRQRGQVEVGGDRLDAEQQGQHQHHEGRRHRAAARGGGRHPASLTGAAGTPLAPRCVARTRSGYHRRASPCDASILNDPGDVPS